ncbi:MAG: hypothetical protein PHX62_07440, partial [Bacilli bacterium]|nr:hypothetical protein [Bacilli bacterium]
MKMTLKRLKILTLLQISNKHKLKKPKNIGRLLANIFLRILGMLIITVACAGITILLVDIIGIPKDHKLLTFFLVLIQLFSIIACIMGLLENLYTSRDNPILLAYPATATEVFVSKLLVFYIYELIKSFYFILPFLIGFGLIVGLLTPLYFLSSILITLILPIFPVLIGALLTIPLIYLKRFLKMHSSMKTILVLILMVALFILTIKISNLLPEPLRILAMYDIFVDKLKGSINFVYEFSLFYSYIGKLFFGINLGIDLLVIVGVIIVLSVLIVLISRPVYFKMASKSGEHANLKKHVHKNVAHDNTFYTFLRKEWILTIRNPSDFINNYSFIIALPYVFYLMMSIFVRVDRNELGDIMMVTFSMLITLLMSTASNTASSMAVTSEGSEFVLMKTAPGKTSNMAWAKILFNLVFSTFVIVLTYLLFIFLSDRKIWTADLILMMFSSI